MSDVNDPLRAALDQIKAVCEDNAPASCHHDMALNFVLQVADAALALPPAAPLRETVLEQSEALDGTIMQTVRFSDGTEVVRAAPNLGPATIDTCIDTCIGIVGQWVDSKRPLAEVVQAIVLEMERLKS